MRDNLRLSLYFAKEKALTAWIIFFGIVTNVLIVWIPAFQGRLIDGVSDGIPRDAVLRAVLLYAGLVFAVQFFRFFKRYLVRKFENRTVMSIRTAIYSNIMNSPIQEVEGETVGSLTNKIIGDVNIVSEGLRKIITEIFDTGVMLAGYLALMAAMDLKITALSCLFIPVAVLLSKLLKSMVTRYNSEYRRSKGSLNDYAYQNITNAVLFRLYGLQDAYNASYKGLLPGLRKKAVRAAFFDTGIEPLYHTISLAGVLFCIYLGSGKIASSLWSVGEFSSFLVMYIAVARKSGKISTYINLWQKTSVSWRRLKTHLAPRPQESRAVPPMESPVTLAFDHVSFGYQPERILIRDLSFRARPGEIIGICGPVACGKSTLLRLLTTESGYSGAVTVGGADLSQLSQPQKAGLIAVKNHEPSIFSASIAENIAFDTGLDLTPVLEDCALLEDVRAMPQGPDTLTGSMGATLSGGQKDRIALARTLLERKPILLLDDPFSSVDGATEAAIIRALRDNYRDSVILLTTHRFTVLPWADRIICFDGRGGYQLGRHQELMATNDAYRKIYHIQRGSAS